MRIYNKLGGGGIALILLLLVIAFFITDCASGYKHVTDAIVGSKDYKPAWTETYTTEEEEEDVHHQHYWHTEYHTIHHPEEFHVWCVVTNGTGTNGMGYQYWDTTQWDVETTAGIFYGLTNLQPIYVDYRRGRWTGIRYLSTIEPDRRLEK